MSLSKTVRRSVTFARAIILSCLALGAAPFAFTSDVSSPDLRVESLATGNDVVDPTFVSTLYDGTGQNRYTQLWPLRDGSVVVGREQWGGVGVGYAWYRVRADGQLDSPTPLWATPSPAYGPRESFLAALSDGSFLTSPPLTRRDRSGAPVTGFHAEVTLESTGSAIVVTEQPDGRLLVGQGAALVRLWPDGSLDRSFSADGNDVANLEAVQLDGAGRIIVARTDERRIVRLTTTGARDTTFQPIEGEARLAGVTADGAVITVRTAPNPVTRNVESTFTRYHPNGIRDDAWSIQAWATVASAVLFAPSGEIYVGYSGLGVVRLTADPVPKLDPTFFSRNEPGAFVRLLALTSDGKLLVLGSFARWGDFTTSSLVRLDPTRTPPMTAPTVSVGSSALVVRRDARVIVQGRALGTGPLAFTWTSLDGGVLPAEVHSPLLVFDSFQRANLGRYQLEVTGPGGSANAVVDLRGTAPPRLVNVSSRGKVATGENLLIAGVALEVPSHSSQYRLVLRGGGPALAPLGVTNPLPDPLLTFVGASGDVVAHNNDWSDTPFTRHAVNLAGAFPFAPNSRDSLVVLDAPGGNYTLTLQDVDGRSGTGLIEAYDVDLSDPLIESNRGAIANLSLRGRVTAGGEPLIAGFVILDPAGFDRSMKILARVAGPALSEFGVADPLSDPRLTVLDANGRIVATNNDWTSSANATETATAASRAGAFRFPSGSKDAALVLDLPAGAYTVHAESADAADGVALIELYRVP